MSQGGPLSGSTSPTPPAPNALVFVKSPLIDFTTTGLTTIFNSGTKSYIVTVITILCDSAIAGLNDSQFNIGFTAPDYNDVDSNISPNVFNTNESNSTFTPAVSLKIPTSTDVLVNVTSASASTELKCYVILTLIPI